MTDSDSTDWYDNHVREAAERYEAVAFPDVHGALLALLPPAKGALALDVGAGSGRDASELGEHDQNNVPEEAGVLHKHIADRGSA